MKHQRWEYKCPVLPVAMLNVEAEKLFNDLGAEGWEMVEGKSAFWFKRPVPEEEGK
jgi:hypothetical protein